MLANDLNRKRTLRLAYIGCWYKNDMYSHNCSDLVEALRAAGMRVDVVTSNCRCFSSAQAFSINKDELININCSPIAIPHAPRNPGKKRGTAKYLAVKMLKLDVLLATARGFLYFQRARRADVIHFDQVLEAFGCIPLFIVVLLSNLFGTQVAVTVHEIDPVQREHSWINRLYNRCAAVFVYSENMKRQVAELGADPGKIRVIRYGASIPELVPCERNRYIYFGGHNILRGKGFVELVDAMVALKSAERPISLLIYVGHGCNGLKEAKELAIRKGVAEMIEWGEFNSGGALAYAYQQSKACIIPYTGGSARHPVTCAMANATPIIATHTVDIPEYLGTLGIYVEGTAESIASAIRELENDRAKDLSALGKRLRAKAVDEFDYLGIATQLAREYSEIAS
ncbi:MAG: glycosyltransferase family 4 protein [Candidatus Acidiferrum sp.]